MAEVRISTHSSESTREQLEQYAEAHGMKKGYVVEQALLHHLQALRELPAEIVIPPRITVSRRSLEKVTGFLKKPRAPTKALRDLLAGEPVDDQR